MLKVTDGNKTGASPTLTSSAPSSLIVLCKQPTATAFYPSCNLDYMEEISHFNFSILYLISKQMLPKLMKCSKTWMFWPTFGSDCPPPAYLLLVSLLWSLFGALTSSMVYNRWGSSSGSYPPLPKTWVHVLSGACCTLLPGLWAENKKAKNEWFQFIYSTLSIRMKVVSTCSKLSLWISKSWPMQSSNDCSFCFGWCGFHYFQRPVKEATGLYYFAVLQILNLNKADLSFFLEIPFIWLLRHDAVDCPLSSTQAFSSVCFSSWQIFEGFKAVFKVTFFPDVHLSPGNRIYPHIFH